MALILITNQASRDSVELVVTDTADAAESYTDIDVLRGGPRYLNWTSIATTAKRFVYVNKSDGLTADYIVVTRMDRHTSKNVKVYSWDTYSGSRDTAIFDDAAFSETLIGIESQDWCFAFGSEATTKSGLGLSLESTAATKTLSQVYFGVGLSFSNISERGDLKFQRVPIHDKPMKHEGHYYRLYGIAEFTVTEVTSADLDTYYDLPKDDPVFFYDSSGNFIEDKLWHCVILEEQVTVVHDELNEIRFRVGILDHRE